MSFTGGTASRIGEATRPACDVLIGASSSSLHLVLFVRTTILVIHPASGFPGQMRNEIDAVFFHDGKGSCLPASL
jgi:hypothetical protein